MNLSIKALFCWVKAATGSGEETHIEDLQNGEILLKLVHLLKKSIPSSCDCVNERFKIISNFITSDCRFNALNGTSIEWEAIKDGRNLSVEIAKVILILVYYDMMNDHCTLKKLDCDVERQIAGLTLTYVEENEGGVSLVPGLDAHLSRRHLTVSHNILEKSATVSTTTTTSVSSLSSLYDDDDDDDDESPLFGRSQKVKFLDLQKVASSSVSSSPIQDVMNTPVFQMRIMKRQLMQDRDYIDGLEKELSNKLALLSQRESQINQLQYCLDKLKEDRGVDEQSTRAHIDELENKKNMLQSCLDDFLKQNKELKNNAALTERKVNELAEENGVLTSQMRTVCSRLAISEAEVGKLTEAHESNEAEWQNGITTLQSELCEARAQKELYAEQIEILQGKISCLKDEIDRSTQEEGENMWISVEKQLLESRICTLTEELENATNSLEKIEVEVQAKTQQLKACEREISDQKELLIQKQNQIDQLLESKNEAIDKLQKEMAEMGETLQQEIQALKLRLEEAEKQKQEQATRFQVQVVSCNEEIEKLKEIKHQKEELLLQTVERADDLMTKLCSANTLLSGRDQEVSGLKEKVQLLTETHQQTKKESQAMFSQLQEKSQEAEALKSLIDSLKDDVNILESSLERAEEEMQIKTTLLSETKRENYEQMEALQRDIVLCKETIETLKMEIRMKDEQIIEAKRNNLMQCEKQQQEICALKAQIGILGESLNEAKQQAQNCQTEAKKQKEESCQNEALLQEQLSSSEEMVKHLKEEINTKTDQLAMLENQSADQLANITDLQQQVASLRAQLVKAEEDVQIKENHFALKQDQVEGLLAQVSQFEDEIKSMQGNLQRKEEELLNLKRETLKHEEKLKEDYLKRSEELDNEISRLTLQVKSLHESLNSTAEQLTVKEDLLARKETELSRETDAAQKLKATVDELIVLRQQLQAKEREMITLKDESDDQSNLQQEEIQIMKSQLEDMAKTLRSSEEGKLQIISEQLKCAQEQKLLQEQLSQCQIVVKQLENEVGAKEREMALNSEQSKALCLQNEDLQKRLESLASSLNEAKQQAQNCQAEAKKQKEESCQNEALLQEQLSSSEEMVKHLKEEINTKTDQLAMLENQSADQLANITDLQQKVASLRAQLVKAEEDVQIKENHFALKQDQVEGLLAQVSQFEDEIKSMQGNLQRKEEELFNLKRETLKHEEQLKEDYLKRSEELDNEISRLTLQVKSLHESLNSTAEQLTVKEDLLARKETELSRETDAAQKLKATVDELIVLRQQLQAKEREMITLKDESDDQSNLQQEEIQIMKSQLEDMAKTLRSSEEGKLQIISEQLKSALEQKLLQEQLSQCQIVVKQLENKVGAKEREMALNSEQSKALCLQNEDLQKRLESLASSLEDAQEKMHSKELLLIQHQQEAKQKQENLMLKVEQAEKETLELKVKSSQSQVDLLQKEELLLQMQEQHQIVQAELSAFKIKMTENDNYVVKLEEEAVAQIEVIRQTKEQLKSKNSAFIELQEQSSRQIGDLQQCVESLKSLLEDRSQNAAAKDEQFRGLQLESVQKIEDLKQELVSVAAELNQQKEMNIHILRQKDETIESTQMEQDSLIKQKAALDARVLAVEQQLEGAVLENKRLYQAKQAFERENFAALKLQAKLQEELQVLKRDNSILLNEKEKVKDVEEEDLLQQLTAKTTAMEHYKAQMEKAMDHYNSKKELLKKSEGEVANLKHALEVQESKLKNVTLEKKLVQMELERIQSNEEKLLNKIASLEARQSFADKAFCEQNTLLNDHKAQGRRASTLEVAGDRFGIKRSKPQSISSDSLDQSSLNDSLNDTRKLSAPESSTPLVRSSERLAAKRHVLQAESLETLYFTPINTRHRSNTGTKPEASAKRNSASSVKRRRTTQVINITMTKKTPGRNEADETFYSLASARSQPNLSSAHKVSTELFNTPKAAESDQLIGLPGYRRSTIHSQATSTFCVGAENEPDGGPEDWMRIAEIQARNKACLPHLKSSYPLEFDSVRNSALIFTDEELRTGDPIETIRRASVMPGQLQDSLTSHRLSYMGQSANMAPSLSRLSTMPGQVNSTLRSPKGSKRAASTLSLHTTSPEKKTRASCFPRPLTPKNRNVSGPAFPHCQTAPSPADRRQSMMFTIDNTPKKDARKDLLKKGLNKLRNSTRKSPGKSLKSPAQSASRRGQENVPTKAGRPAVGGAGRLGSQKSPQVPNKGQRKSPRGPQRAAKSPGITASARKGYVPVSGETPAMMSRMKV